MRNALVVCFSAAALTGCALLGKSEPSVPHYFTPELDGSPAVPRAPPGLQLRLGRVEGWSHLRERMVARSAAGELSYSDDRRWTERPEVYLRRALSRALFEERGLVEALSGRAITLEVELIAFEEVERPHVVRMQARLALRDDRLILFQETVTVEQPVAPSEGAGQARALVEAFSSVLRTGVTRISDQVMAQLAEQSPQASR
jgi:cholesterol transport system auxiliary component